MAGAADEPHPPASERAQLPTLPTAASAASAPPASGAGEDASARVADLTTGFALGELSDEELREFYDLLRDADGRGAQAARIAWHTLGVITDLRSEVAHAFQDSLRLRLGHDQGSREFRNRLWNRLGFRILRLDPVSTPGPHPPFAAARLVVALLCVLAAVACAAFLVLRSSPVRATVTHLLGTASCAGRALVPESIVDGRPILVMPGGQLGLRWPDGSTAIITGGHGESDEQPAEATVRGDGLTLQQGRAWISAHADFALSLPGRSGRVTSDEASVALEAGDGEGFIGIRHGSFRVDGMALPIGDNEGIGPGSPFRWVWEWDATAGALSLGDLAPPDWRLSAELTWKEPADRAQLTLAHGTHPVITLICSPGLCVIDVDGHETQRIIVPGSPLLGYHVELRQRHPRLLTVTLADQSARLTLPQPIDRYTLSDSPDASCKIIAFYPLPDPRPPQGTGSW